MINEFSPWETKNQKAKFRTEHGLITSYLKSSWIWKWSEAWIFHLSIDRWKGQQTVSACGYKKQGKWALALFSRESHAELQENLSLNTSTISIAWHTQKKKKCTLNIILHILVSVIGDPKELGSLTWAHTPQLRSREHYARFFCIRI